MQRIGECCSWTPSRRTPSTGMEWTCCSSIRLIGGLTPANGARNRTRSLPSAHISNLHHYKPCARKTVEEIGIFRWDFCKEGERLFANLNPMVAYEKGLTTWAKWVDLHLDPRRTRVIFRSVSPRHNRYEQQRSMPRPSSARDFQRVKKWILQGQWVAVLQETGAGGLHGLLAANAGATCGVEGGAEEDELPCVPDGRHQHVCSARRRPPFDLWEGEGRRRRPACLGLHSLVLARSPRCLE